jgi:hypothetical protein
MDGPETPEVPKAEVVKTVGKYQLHQLLGEGEFGK